MSCRGSKSSAARVLTLIFLSCAHQAYLHVQLGTIALDGERHDDAADHFTAAVNTGALSSNSTIHYIYEDLVVVCRYDASENTFRAHLHALCSCLGGT